MNESINLGHLSNTQKGAAFESLKRAAFESLFNFTIKNFEKLTKNKQHRNKVNYLKILLVKYTYKIFEKA